MNAPTAGDAAAEPPAEPLEQAPPPAPPTPPSAPAPPPVAPPPPAPALAASGRDRSSLLRTASRCVVLAVVAVTLLIVVWLFTYEKVFRVLAQTQVIDLDVAPGPQLRWPLRDAVLACDTDAPRPVDAQALLLSQGLRVRLYPVRLPAAASGVANVQQWVFEFQPGERPAPTPGRPPPPPPLALDSAPGRALALPLTACLGTADAGYGLNLPLHGDLVLGASPSDQQQQLLLVGRLTLSEAHPAWIDRWWLHTNEQFDADQAELEVGDKVLLPGAGACAGPRDDCAHALGFVRLAPPEDGRPADMTVRAVAAAAAVDIVRPYRPVQRLQPSIVRRFTNDRLLSWLGSLWLLLCGAAWGLFQLMHAPTDGKD